MIKRVKSRSKIQIQQRVSFHLSRVKTEISERNFIAGPFISQNMKFLGYFQANVYFVLREKLLVTLAMTICFIHFTYAVKETTLPLMLQKFTFAVNLDFLFLYSAILIREKGILN